MRPPGRSPPSTPPTHRYGVEELLDDLLDVMQQQVGVFNGIVGHQSRQSQTLARIELALRVLTAKETHDMSGLSDSVQKVGAKLDTIGTQLATIKADAEATITLLKNDDVDAAIKQLEIIASNADTHSQTAAQIASELEAAVPAVHAADPNAPAPPPPADGGTASNT